MLTVSLDVSVVVDVVVVVDGDGDDQVNEGDSAPGCAAESWKTFANL